jgi:uncharacterized protein involved in exopolysaccharide biosynthesis
MDQMRDSETMYERTETEMPSLRDLVAPLFRRRKLVLSVFISVFVFATIAGIMLFCTKYESHMEVLVGQDRRIAPVSTDNTSQAPTAVTPLTDEEVNSEAELLRSGDVLRKVVLQNGLQDRGLFIGLVKKLPWISEADRIDGAVRTLAKKLKVETIDKTNLIGVKYKTSDPQLSYSVLNSLGNYYMSAHMAVQRPNGAYQFFEKQTQQYKARLDQSEAALKALGHDKKVSSPDDERIDLAIQASNFVGLVHTTEQAIAADEHKIASDKQQIEATPARSPTLQVSNSADLLLEQLQPALLAAQTKRSQLLLRYEPSYPLVQEADRDIALAKTAVDEAEKTKYLNETTDRDPTFELLREDMAKTTSDLAAQKASLVSLRSSIKSIQSQMVDLDSQAINQGDLRREFKANESNYLLYLNKREQERTSDALDLTRISNVVIAIPPNLPVMPVFGFPLVLLGALAVALIFSLSSAYAFDYFDSSFQTPAQVRETLGIPIVVAISRKTA